MIWLLSKLAVCPPVAPSLSSCHMTSLDFIRKGLLPQFTALGVPADYLAPQRLITEIAASRQG
jgi:hypothetical protein